MKKHGVVSKLFLALLALVLISFCFLGLTFARYTSSGSGDTTATIAKWDIQDSTSGNLAHAFENIAPANEAYKGKSEATAPTARTITVKQEIAQITNGGKIDADITFTVSDLTISASSYDLTGYSLTSLGAVQGNGASEAQIKRLFSISYKYQIDEGGETALVSGTPIDLAQGKKITIYAYVTWTSDDVQSFAAAGTASISGDEAKHTAAALLADAIDNWAGKNVTSLTCKLSYVALQSAD